MTETSSASPVESQLADKNQRLLVQLLEHALEDGWRTPEDFLRHFPAAAIVQALERSDELRVQLLVRATGMHEKIALKKAISSAAEDLELALEEGTTSAADVLASFPPDDRVRLLDTNKLWAFLTENEFWQVRPAENKAAHERAAGRIAFTLESALGEDIISLKDITDGLGFDTIANNLPPKRLQAVVQHALEAGRDGSAFTEELLLEIVPLDALTELIDLRNIWDNVILDKIAVPCGFAEAATPSKRGGRKSERVRKSEKRQPATPPTAEEASDVEASASNGASPEDAALERVRARLKAIDRLPPDESLPFPVLASIESMYADLTAITDEGEREDCVKEAFPNEAMLRQAMLSLIQLLDPTVDTTDPVIKDANVEALIKIVLFEERRRREMARPSTSPSAPPPPPPGAKRSVPPPLKKRREVEEDISLDVELDVD